MAAGVSKIDDPSGTPAGPPQPSTAQLRPALLLALEVARTGTGRMPGRMRSLTQARRLPANWAGTARRVLEEDEVFRTRVAAAATESSLGPLAWLWLARPEGWPDALAAQLDETTRTAEEDPVKELDAVVSRLSEMESELARARAQLAALQAANTQLVESAERDRGGRAQLVNEHQEEKARWTKALSERDDEVKELRARTHRLQTELQRATRQLEKTEVARQEASEASVQLSRDRDAARLEAVRLAEVVAGQGDALGRAVDRAAAAALELGDALGEASRALRPPEPPAPSRPRARRSKRTAIRLPPAVLDDSAEAAAHLVRIPEVLLIVDGYNVALTSWGNLDLPDLRRRLIDALAELAIRLKLSVLVVFDGEAAGGRLPAPRAAQPWMRVEFSPSTVEADALIVAAVDEQPAVRPIVVATNDREVQRQAYRRGANVIGVDQVLAILGRSASVTGS
jgi:predicted RNA-binding protein with PIN domain